MNVYLSAAMILQFKTDLKDTIAKQMFPGQNSVQFFYQKLDNKSVNLSLLFQTCEKIYKKINPVMIIT